MTAARGVVLFVDDDASMRQLVTGGLGRREFEVIACGSAADAIARATAGGVEVVVTDLNLGGTGGIELCRHLRAGNPDLPVIVLTAFGSLDTAVQAIRAGAYDFLTKPVDIDALALAIDRAREWRELRCEVRRLREGRDAPGPDRLVGDSAAIRRLRDIIRRIGPTSANVLITGETGTGKELVARALHAASARAKGPFVAVNCAAIAPGVIESELFGHVRGAFTGAHRDHPGLFRQAAGGTLFLDEVGDLDPAMQPKLLRALQEQVVRPVGGSDEVEVDARVIAATHRDLPAAVEDGRFRGDLYYRLDVVGIAVPPLRERGGDVLQMAQAFVVAAAQRSGKNVTGITAAAARRLLDYPWPGNVRELENAIESAVALTHYDQLTVDDLPTKIREHRDDHVVIAASDMTGLVPLEEVERRYILRVLAAAGDNRTVAARILGLDRKTLYRKLRAYAEEPGAPEGSGDDPDAAGDGGA